MAVYANINIDQGADYESVVTVEGGNGTPYDLTGFTAKGWIKRNYKASTSYPFTASVADATGGEIALKLPRTVSSTMKPGRYVYDVIITDNATNEVTRVVEGQVEINPRVTV